MDLDNTIGVVLGAIFSITGFYFLQRSEGLSKILSLSLLASGVYVCYHFWAWDEYMVNG